MELNNVNIDAIVASLQYQLTRMLRIFDITNGSIALKKSDTEERTFDMVSANSTLHGRNQKLVFDRREINNIFRFGVELHIRLFNIFFPLETADAIKRLAFLIINLNCTSDKLQLLDILRLNCESIHCDISIVGIHAKMLKIDIEERKIITEVLYESGQCVLAYTLPDGKEIKHVKFIFNPTKNCIQVITNKKALLIDNIETTSVAADSVTEEIVKYFLS